VVRVLDDDAVQAEYHIPPEVGERSWRPMKALEVGPDLRPRLVEWSEAELAAGLDRATPSVDGAPVGVGTSAGEDSDAWLGCLSLIAVFMLAPAVVLVSVRKLMRRRR